LDWTLLHATVNCFAVDSTAVLEMLLSAGAAVDARDGVRGKTSAHCVEDSREEG
jgi:hypothetical protein